MLLAALTLYFIFSSSVAFAQFDFITERYAGGVKDMLRWVLGSNVPEEWLSLPNFVYFVAFPFVAAWAVIYGVMEEIQIFRRAKTSHKVVSFVMAAMLLPSGWLMIIVNYFYMIDAWVALVTFGAVFLVGTLTWGYGRVIGSRTDWYEHGQKDLGRQLNNQINDYNDQLMKLHQDFAAGHITDVKYRQDLLEIMRKRDAVKVRLREMTGP